MIWTAVLVAAAGCYGLKVAGWAVPSSVLDRAVARAAVTLLPIALLAALVVVQVFGSGHRLVVDARAAALVAGAVALALRAPFIVVLVVAAGTAALLRAL